MKNNQNRCNHQHNKGERGAKLWHAHAARVLHRGDSDKAHGLVMTHRESLTRFDTSRLRGVAAPPLDSPAGFSGLPEKSH